MNIYDNENAVGTERLSIADLERASARDIWVLNTSHGNNCGAVAFQCAGESGPIHIEVPYTFVAVNLADQASPELILRSESFRRAVSRNFLTIISPQAAARQNAGQQAAIELDKIRRGISVGVAESVSTINGNTDLSSNKQFQANLGSVNVKTQETGRTDGNGYDPQFTVDSRVLAVMNNNDLSGEEKVNHLRTHKESIKLVDAFYISSVGVINDEEAVIEAGSSMVRTLKKRVERNESNPAEYIKTAKKMAQSTIRS